MFPSALPSIYLRLLEDPNAVAHPISLYSPKTPPPQNGYSQSPSRSRSKSPLSPHRSPSPNVTEQHYPQCTSPDLATNHFSASSLSASCIGHPSENEEEAISQDKAQRLSAKEFNRKSIKERAVLLCSMFPGSNQPPPPAPLSPLPSLSESQVELSTSSSPSPSPPLAPSISKSSTLYPVVHPVPDPAAQACFSSLLPNAAGLKDKSHKTPSPAPSYSDCEKAEAISSLRVDSSPFYKTSSRPSSPCTDESQQISSPSSDTNCENGHKNSSSLPVSLPHKGKSQKLDDSTQDKVQVNAESAQEKVREKFHEVDGNKLTDNGHEKRTIGKVSSAIDAKAQALAILYETDHRPNATPALVPWGRGPKAEGENGLCFVSMRAKQQSS
uniref:uncharacterized protein n=1 Tax=Centroberyx gerrardi TaxID=166262 RepID=UPI003AAD363A